MQVNVDGNWCIADKLTLVLEQLSRILSKGSYLSSHSSPFQHEMFMFLKSKPLKYSTVQ